MCYIRENAESLVDEIEETLGYKEDEPKIDGEATTVNIPHEAYSILKDEWGEHKVLPTIGAYIMAMVSLSDKVSDITALQEKVDPNSECANLRCPKAGDCPFVRLCNARKDVLQLLKRMGKEETEYRLWAKEESWGDDWTWRMESKIGGGIF